jgi:ParE-like toxin of type II ParDE toxin-antitoxin system
MAEDPMIDKVIEAVESLRVRPARQRLRNELGPGLRGLSVGNYIVFYRESPARFAQHDRKAVPARHRQALT